VGVVLWDRWIRAQSSARLANELLRITEDENKRLYASLEEGRKRLEKEQETAREFRNLVFSETYRSTTNLPN
jgi:molecular chaperone GrpE (heat shock protein)